MRTMSTNRNETKRNNSAPARFTSPIEICYTTSQLQESACQTMLRNGWCIGYWLVGRIRENKNERIRKWVGLEGCWVVQ